MAIASCPKCATNLKVPDGTTAAVRCPKCQTVFKPKAPSQPAFEVVDEKAPPKPAPKPAAPAPKPTPKPAAKPADDFEVVDDAPKKKVTARSELDDDDDRPRSKKRSRDDDDDDDRDRKKKRRDDDDEDDDRPRSKKRSRDDDDDDDRDRKKRRDDDDDDDDRPRGKKRSRDDDDEDDDRPRKKKKSGRDDYDYTPPGKGAKFGLGRTGLLLVMISLGLYGASMGLHMLFLLIALIGGVIPSGLSIMTGILGLANWVVGLVGLGFTIAGPARSRGLAIAAVSVAGVHLILAFIVVNDTKSSLFSSNGVQSLSAMNRQSTFAQLVKDYQKEAEKNPGSAKAKELREEMKSYEEDFRDVVIINEKSSSSKMRWNDFTTFLPYLDELIVVLSYQSKIGLEYGWYLLGFFTGGLELARLILVALLIKSMAGAAKRYDAETKAKIGWIAAAGSVGVALLVFILTMVIVDSYTSDLKKGFTTPGTQLDGEKAFEKIQSMQKAMVRWGGVGELLVFLLHFGSLVMPALAALTVFSATSTKSGRSRDRVRDRDDDDD